MICCRSYFVMPESKRRSIKEFRGIFAGRRASSSTDAADAFDWLLQRDQAWRYAIRHLVGPQRAAVLELRGSRGVDR